MKWWIPAVCVSFLISGTAFGAPKEKPKKGTPSDQEILDLQATLTDDSDMHADGNLTDWDEDNGTKVKFQTLLSGEYDYDWTGPKDLSGSVMAQYGADRIYFLIQVRDNFVVAKRKQWKSDRVELWLSSEPAGAKPSSPRGILLDVGPQVAGGQATVKWMSGKKGGLEATAYVSPDGYDFEVAVDYSALGKSPVMDGAMRYCVLVRDWDQDDENEDEASIGTCPINPNKSSSIKASQMGKIELHLADEMWRQILRNDKDVFSYGGEWKRITGDIGGNAHPEIIAFGGDTLVVAGVGLTSPKLSWFKMVLEAGQSDHNELEIRDIDGDKHPEIILKRNEHCTNGAMNADREYIFKYVDSSMRLVTSYITVQREDDGSASIQNRVKFGKNGIVQTLEKSSSNMNICQLNGSGDLLPLLAPADGMTTRTIPL